MTRLLLNASRGSFITIVDESEEREGEIKTAHKSDLIREWNNSYGARRHFAHLTSSEPSGHQPVSFLFVLQTKEKLTHITKKTEKI
jgi:hypothetical protein